MTKKDGQWIYYVSGFMLIFGVSGLIYGLLPYPFIIGSVSVVASFIMIMILLCKKRKRKK